MTAPATPPRERPLHPPAPSAAVPLVVFVVLSAAAGFAGVLSYGATQADLYGQRLRELEGIAALKVGELERWREERLSDAALVASALSPAPGAASPAGESPEGRRRVATWFERLRNSGDYSTVEIVTPEGRLETSSGTSAEPADPDLLDAARTAIREDRIVTTGVHRVGITGALHLDVAAPIDVSGGRSASAVVLRVDPYRYLFRLLQSWPGPSRTGEALLVWRDGDRVRFANELRHWDDDPLALSVPLERHDDPAARAAAGEAGPAEGTDYRGRRVLAAMVQVPDTPWALVVKLDREEAEEPLRERAAWIAIAALALVTASGAGVTLWWRRQRAIVDRQRMRDEVERAALAQRVELLTRYGNDIVLFVGPDLVIRDANDRAALALGRSPGELVGLSLRDLRDPATLGDLDDRIREEREKGFARFETRFRRKDGSTFPVEMSVRVMSLGGLPHHHAIVRDITERRANEEALRASEEKFRAAFEQAALGIALVGLDGRLLETNRSYRRILRMEEQDPRGLLVTDLVQPDDLAASREVLRDLLAGRRDSTEEPRHLRRADGTQVETVIRARAIRGPAGDVQYLLATIEDVSDRKRMEAQLIAADRMASVGTLAAGVAHEINNPLSFVLGNVEFVIDELHRDGGHADLLTALEEAKEGGARVREIVRDLKTFSRPQGGDRALVNVRDVLRSAVSLAINEIRHRARLELDLGEVPDVVGSERRLGQVFLNLLVNAAQAIPEGHAEANVIRAVTRTGADGATEVEISDTGAGIDPAIADRIFEPFFTTKPVGVGTGLGLAICLGIVTDLGGTITARSEPGRGTTFLVTLPAAPAGPRERPALPPPQPAGRAGRILLVDDEPLVARAVTRILSPPHEVVAVTSARAALELIQAGDRAFDVLLCDLMMPDMLGMELHERLDALAPGLAARMVFVTGGAFTASAQEFLDRVPNERVEKPVDAAALRELVNRLLAR